MSTKAKKAPAPPPDPDPTPVPQATTEENGNNVAREERKKIMKNYGRNKTVLAAANEQKKTVLGG